jgi:trans-2,3-dihydro-3-hydroxyanthranilate isomerase
MPHLPFLQIDAFTDRAFGGNPCAVVFDADSLSSDTMQRIAREMNLSETAFVVSSQTADFGARYFTPAEEIPMAGHPTVATILGLMERKQLPFPSERIIQTTLELKAGILPIEIKTVDDQQPIVTMSQMKPQFLTCCDPEEVALALNVPREGLAEGVPIQVVSTGTPQLMVPLKKQSLLKEIEVNLPAFIRLKNKVEFFSTHIFCLEGATAEGKTFARHFSPPPDIFEDPFTGSATGGMAAYLWHYHLIEEPTFVAEQGHWLNRPGKAYVEVVGPRQAIETVKVSGGGVVVIRGELSF